MGSSPILAAKGGIIRCDCIDKEGEQHACPFQEDVNGNDDPEYCNCCDDCKYDCAMSI